MTQLTFNQSTALSLYQSNEPFPIDLDDAWQWLGWGAKQKTLDCILANFEDDLDFLTLGKKASNGGRPGKHIVLSIDCFKHLAMMSGTPQGKAIRKYFLECERIAKSAIAKQAPQQERLQALDIHILSISDEIKAHESAVRTLRVELQDLKQVRLNEAIAFLKAYPDLGETYIHCKEILRENNNSYLSVGSSTKR